LGIEMIRLAQPQANPLLGFQQRQNFALLRQIRARRVSPAVAQPLRLSQVKLGPRYGMRVVSQRFSGAGSKSVDIEHAAVIASALQLFDVFADASASAHRLKRHHILFGAAWSKIIGEAQLFTVWLARKFEYRRI